MSRRFSVMSRADVAADRVEVDALTRAILAKLEEMRPGECTKLMVDPCSVIASWHDVDLQYVPAVETDSRCSVGGAYIWDATPPVLAVAQSASAGRRAFTALHEVGHHIQQTDVELAEQLANAGERGRVLEDAVCDAFAAAVLLPDELVDQHIPAAGPTVHDVVRLHARSSASRAAVCVRAGQRLRSPGHVLLLDYDGTVQFATTQGLPPVTKGSNQSNAPVIQQALGAVRGASKGRTRLIFRDSIRGEELFAQAADLRGYLVVVTMTDRPPWEESFVLPSRGTAPISRRWICEQPGCENEFFTFDLACQRCRTPKCPECGRCRCAPAVAEKQCKRCSIVYPARFFDSGSTVCQDCS
jgi:hypothetical protein